MATAKASFTNSQSITITLASLANGSTNASNAIDNSTNLFLSANVQVKVRTGSSGAAATGVTNVYLVRSADGGTTYDDSTRTLLGTLATNANSTTYINTWSTEPLGQLGTHWKIAVENRSGGTFDSTAGNHSAAFAGFKGDIS